MGITRHLTTCKLGENGSFIDGPELRGERFLGVRLALFLQPLLAQVIGFVVLAALLLLELVRPALDDRLKLRLSCDLFVCPHGRIIDQQPAVCPARNQEKLHICHPTLMEGGGEYRPCTSVRYHAACTSWCDTRSFLCRGDAAAAHGPQLVNKCHVKLLRDFVYTCRYLQLFALQSSAKSRHCALACSHTTAED